MMTVVPSPTFVWISNASDTFFILGRPMPAPNPLARISSEAVDQPSCMAFCTSGIPGPWSMTLTVMAFGEKSAKDLAPAAMDQTIDFPFVGSNGNAAHKVPARAPAAGAFP